MGHRQRGCCESELCRSRNRVRWGGQSEVAVESGPEPHSFHRDDDALDFVVGFDEVDEAVARDTPHLRSVGRRRNLLGTWPDSISPGTRGLQCASARWCFRCCSSPSRGLFGIPAAATRIRTRFERGAFSERSPLAAAPPSRPDGGASASGSRRASFESGYVARACLRPSRYRRSSARATPERKPRFPSPRSVERSRGLRRFPVRVSRFLPSCRCVAHRGADGRPAQGDCASRPG